MPGFSGVSRLLGFRNLSKRERERNDYAHVIREEASVIIMHMSLERKQA